MELISTKLLSLEHPVQIVGMSATIPVSKTGSMNRALLTSQNMSLMAQWLDAHSYETRYRPIPIEEHVVCNGSVYEVNVAHTLLDTATQLTNRGFSEKKAKASRKIVPSSLKDFADPVLNAVISLTHETATSGYGVLVFAGSRSMCESDARIISRVMPQLSELSEAVAEARKDLLDELRSLSTGVDHVLEETVMFGVAFHRTYITPFETNHC